MINSYKISFSLPRDDFMEIERIRQRMGLGRSAIIDMAIRFWINWLKQVDLIKKYEEGYKKTPEKVYDLKALEISELETLNSRGEW